MQNCKSLVLHADTHDISIIKQINLKFYVYVLIILEWKVDQWENISLSPNDISWRLNSMHWADFKCCKHEARTCLLQKLECCSKIRQNFPSNWLIKECGEYKLPRKGPFVDIISGKTEMIILQTLCLHIWSNKLHGSTGVMGGWIQRLVTPIRGKQRAELPTRIKEIRLFYYFMCYFYIGIILFICF